MAAKMPARFANEIPSLKKNIFGAYVQTQKDIFPPKKIDNSENIIKQNTPATKSSSDTCDAANQLHLHSARPFHFRLYNLAPNKKHVTFKDNVTIRSNGISRDATSKAIALAGCPGPLQ